MSLLAELQRRKVFNVGAAYLVVGWLLIQIAATVAPQLNLPEWAPRLITFVILLGFPLALLLAWAVDVSADGIKIEQAPLGNKRVYIAVAALVALVLAWYFYGQPAFRKVDVPAPTIVAPTVSEKSIAVLPFVNMSDDKQNEYFSDGLSEELLNQLAQLPQLRVIARTSSFSFKGKEVDVATIAKALNVANVLEGSVRKSGNTLRITAQLIRASDSSHLWSHTYDRELTDIFKIQDEIAGAIAEALEAKLGGRPVATTSARTANPAAYDDYLQGRAFVARRWADNLDKAGAAFDRAIAQDPGYSAAHSGRAFAFLLRPMWGPSDLAKSLAQARGSADKALQLDPDNAEAFMVRGMAASFSRDPIAAAADLDRAKALAPGSVDVLNMDGDFRINAGDFAAGERDKRQAMALDPLAFVHPLNISDVMGSQGRYAEAVVAANQALALGAAEYGYSRLVFAYTRLGRIEDARDAVEKLCAINPASIENCEWNKIQLLANDGHRSEAKARLDAVARKLRNGLKFGFTTSSMAALYVEVGDVAAATRWQRMALDEGDWFLTAALIGAPGGAKLPEEISQDPGWLAVWADPRLKDVMANYRRNLLAWRACSKAGTACP